MNSRTLHILPFLLAILILPACNQDNKKQDATVEIDSNVTPADVSIDSLRYLVDNYTPGIDRNDQDLVHLYEATQPVSEILGKMVQTSKLANSPNNNLNWFRVSKALIAGSDLPEDSVFNTMDGIISWYDGRDQRDMNYAAYMRQVIAHYRQLEEFNDYLDLFPDQYREYEIWSGIQSDLIDAYVEGMYENNHYSSLPMDISAGIVARLDRTTAILKMQNDLLRGMPVNVASEINDTQSLEEEKSNPEIAEWEKEREKVSKSLPPDMQREYNKISLLLEKSIFK